MVNTDSEHLMFVQPRRQPSADPVIDDVTRKMTAAWRARSTSNYAFRGVHSCTGANCRANSDNRDHWVGGLATNSLSIHYVAHHRDEVPKAQLDIISRMTIVGADPTLGEMAGEFVACTVGEDDAIARRH